MHRIFATEALVLHKRGIGEANVLLFLLTRDLGLLRVSARSARLGVSKLRYGLEPLTRGRFSLVRGRYEWKLTGAEAASRLPGSATREQRHAAGRVLRLLMRLIHGEEPVPELYDMVLAGLDALSTTDNPADIDSIECILVLRTLSQLGYVSQTPELAPFLDANEFAPATLTASVLARPLLIRTINTSLVATGL